MKNIEITALELFKTISELPQSSENTIMESASKNALNKILFNQILTFSTEELNSVSARFARAHAFYTTLLKRDTANPFLFGAIIEKRVSEDLYSKETKFVLNKIKNLTLKEYDLIYNFEFYNLNKNVDSNLNHFRNKDPIISMLDYLRNNSEYTNDFLDKVFEFESNKKIVLKYIIDSLYRYDIDNFTGIILQRFSKKELMIKDINDKLKIPEQSKEYKPLNLFIKDIEHIERLLSAGFRFKEDSFEYFGKSLYTTILDSSEIKLIKAVLPTLKNIPKDEEIEYNRAIIEKYKNKPYYQEVKTIFEYQVLNDKINKDNVLVKKIKI